MPPFDVPMPGPCKTVLTRKCIHHPDQLRALCPHVPLIQEIKVDSYCGVPIVDSVDRVVGQLDKVQLIDAMWDNKEKRREEPFLSLRLMHGDEAHLLLALNDEERASLLKFASAVTAARNPER